MREAVAIVPEGRRVFFAYDCGRERRWAVFADRDQFQTRIKWVYELFPRLHERRIQRAGTMSGGEQQMLAIGRALMSQPRLLLLIAGAGADYHSADFRHHRAAARARMTIFRLSRTPTGR